MSTVSQKKLSLVTHADALAADADGQPPEPKTPKPYWRRPWVIAAAGGLLGLWLLPWVIAHSFIGTAVLRSATADLNGSLEVQSLSLGWFSPVGLAGVKLSDKQNNVVAEVPQISGDRSLLGLIFDRSRLGTFRIRDPKLTIVLRDDGSNLEDVLANYMKSESESSADVSVEVTGGAVSIKEAQGARRTRRITDFSLTLVTPGDRAKPIELSASGNIPDREQGASFRADLKLYRQAKAKGARPQGADELKLNANMVPLEIFEPVARRAIRGATLAGRLTCDLRCGWDRTKADKINLEGKLSTANLVFGAEALGPDPLSMKSLSAEGRMTAGGSRLDFDRLVTRSDLGNLNVTGALDLTGGTVAEQLETLLNQNYEIEGELWLDKLASRLPNVIRTPKGTTISSGRLSLRLVGRQGRDGGMDGALALRDLKTAQGTRQIEIKQEVQARLVAYASRQGPVLKSFALWAGTPGAKADALPLEVTGSGYRDQLDLKARFDLAELAKQVGAVVDLGQLQLAGDGEAQLGWSRKADGSFKAGAKVKLANIHIAEPGRTPWKEEHLQLAFRAAGRGDFERNNSLDSAELALEAADGERWEARLREPVARFALDAGIFDRPWAVELDGKGQLAVWQGRLDALLRLSAWDLLASPGTMDSVRAALRSADQWKIVGESTLLVDATLLGKAIDVQRARLTVSDFRAQSAGWDFREPKIEFSGRGAWDHAAGQLELPELTFSSSTLGLKVTRARCQVPAEGPVRLMGTAQYEGRLQRLQQARVTSQPPDWQLSGHLIGDAEIDRSGRALVRATIDNLAVASPKNPPYQDGAVQLALQGSYNQRDGAITIDQGRLTSNSLRAVLRGTVGTQAEGPGTELAGDLDCNFTSLTRLIQAVAGSGLRIDGHHKLPFDYRAAARGGSAVARAGLAWDSIDAYGFRAGPHELEIRYADRAISCPSMVLGVNEGTLRLSPRIAPASAAGPAWKKRDYVFTLPQGRLAERVRINPAACAKALGYALPLLSGSTTAEGLVSIDLQQCVIPISSPADALIDGTIYIQNGQITPGGLLREIALIFGRGAPAQIIREASVPFRVAERRVYHKNLQLTFDKVTVQTEGYVGFDQRLALTALVTLPDRWQNNPALAAALRGQAIRLAIGGTLAKPKIDRSGYDGLARQFLQNAAQNAIQEQVKGQMERWLGPIQPAAPEQKPPPTRAPR